MDHRIAKVLDFLEDHLSAKIRIKELAGIACMSISQFHRQFKAETGRTPLRFCEELRISKAYQLILTENSTTLDLAVKLGYNDYETFSRAFKKYYFLAPDDLKLIAQEIRSHFKHEDSPEIMFIPVEEESTAEEIKLRFQQILDQRGLSIDELPESTAYKIDRKQKSQGRSLKNKFKITRDQKMWSALVNKSSKK